MKLRKIVIPLILFFTLFFVGIGLGTGQSQSVDMGQSFGLLSGEESTVKDGDVGVPVSNDLILTFNRNIATDDVFDYNKKLIKVYDNSGTEIPTLVEANSDNSVKINVADGLKSGQSYIIIVDKGLEAQGATEHSEDAYEIAFTTENPIPNEGEEVAAPQEQPAKSLDTLKAEVELARRQSEENAKAMKEAQEKEAAAKEAEKKKEEKPETEIPAEKPIDPKDIDQAVTKNTVTEDGSDNATNPKTFIGAVIILALIVIILAAIVFKTKSVNKNHEKQEEQEEQEEEEDKITPENLEEHETNSSEDELGDTGRFKR